VKDRAIRRAEVERLKRKRSKYWGRDGKLSQRQLGMALHTPAICSCWMCGNDRKYLGERTIQERRQMQDIEDDMDIRPNNDG
jgi:hypothetical protein